VRADGVALVAASKRRHQQLRSCGHAQVIRPEGHQPLEERSIGGDPGGEGGAAVRIRDGNQPAPRLSALLRTVLVGGAEVPHRLANRSGRRVRRCSKERRAAIELSPEPAPRVGETAAFTGPRPEPESIQRPKCEVHQRSDGGGID
jgi:hypothetical protein